MRKKIVFFAITVFLFIFFLIYYRTYAINLNSRYAYDEISWIGRGYYADLLLRGDIKNPLWKDCYIDTDPKLPSYIYGLSYYGGYLEARRFNRKLDAVNFLINREILADKFICPEVKNNFDVSINKNIFFENRKEMDKTKLVRLEKDYGAPFQKIIPLLLSARKTAIFFTAFTVVIIFFTVFFIEKSILFALITAFMVGASDLFLLFGTVAYSEPFFIFLISISLLLLILVGKKNSPIIFLSVALGVVVGLLNQTKINGVIILFIYLSILSIIFIKSLFFSLPVKQIFFSAFLAVVLFFLTFISTDPTLWETPIKSILYKYQTTQTIALYQQKHNQKIALTSAVSRFYYLYSYYFSDPPFMNFYNQYQNNHYRPIYILKGGFLLVFLVGLLNLAWSAIVDLRVFFSSRQAFLSKRTIFFICFSVFFLALLNYLVLALRRYLIHMNFFIVYVAVFGCYQIVGFIFNLLIKKNAS